MRAKYVGLAEYCSLNHDHVIDVANWGCQQRVQRYNFRRPPQDGEIIENKLFSKAKEFLQPRVTKYSGKLV